MKKLLSGFFLLFFLLCFFACEEECKDEDVCAFSNTDLAYFGNFHPDYSWEYISQRKVRDYISISNYKYQWNKSSKSGCYKEFISSMKINSRYLGFNKAGFRHRSCDFSHFIMYNSKESTFHFTSEEGEQQYKDAIIIDSLTLRDGTVFKNVLFKERIWIAPNIGIVQFTHQYSESLIDTFSICNFYKREW